MADPSIVVSEPITTTAVTDICRVARTVSAVLLLVSGVEPSLPDAGIPPAQLPTVTLDAAETAAPDLITATRSAGLFGPRRLVILNAQLLPPAAVAEFGADGEIVLRCKETPPTTLIAAVRAAGGTVRSDQHIAPPRTPVPGVSITHDGRTALSAFRAAGVPIAASVIAAAQLAGVEQVDRNWVIAVAGPVPVDTRQVIAAVQAGDPSAALTALWGFGNDSFALLSALRRALAPTASAEIAAEIAAAEFRLRSSGAAAAMPICVANCATLVSNGATRRPKRPRRPRASVP